MKKNPCSPACGEDKMTNIRQKTDFMLALWGFIRYNRQVRYGDTPILCIRH